MALASFKTWNAGDVLTAADLNGSFNNILNNGLSVVSPWTASMDGNFKQLLNLSLEQKSAAVTPANIGRLYYRTDTATIEWDTGTTLKSPVPYAESGGQLTKSGASLLFAPYQHTVVFINSTAQTIPDAGVSLAIGAAVANTRYNIFVFMSGVTMTLEFSTTTTSVQAGTGITIKSGDATRSFVGSASTDATPNWVASSIFSFYNGAVSTTPTVPLRSYLAGLTLSTAGSSTTMTTAAGQATDDGQTTLLNLASSIAKTTGAWAVGTATGGLDTGAIANSTWYHFYIIGGPTKVTDVLFSLSASAPTLPAGYTIKRRYGSGKTDGGGNWIAFVQDTANSDYFRLLASVRDVNTNNPGTAAISATLASVPTGINVDALVRVAVRNNGTAASVLVSDLGANDEAPVGSNIETAPGYTMRNQNATTVQWAPDMRIRTNTSGQIRYRLDASDANVTVDIVTIGWYDSRGKNA